MQKKIAAVFIVGFILLTGIIYYNNGVVSTGLGKEKPKIVITLGQDLTEKQKQEVMKMLGGWKKDKEARFITISNAEERKYLEGKVDDKLIGTRAISCAYLELLDGNSGVEVQTENITSITSFMYANALTTAGVEDARVIVAAPFEVSGTAALTGIIKAFETANAEKLDANAKETAYEELTETYKLSDKYGKKNTENMIYDIKRQVIEKDATTPEQIRPIIIEISNHYSIDLTTAEIDRIIVLMQKFENIKLDTGKIDEQLSNLTRNLAEVQGAAHAGAGFLEQIISFLENLVLQIKSMWS